MSRTILTVALLLAVLLGVALAWRSMQTGASSERMNVEPMDVGAFREVVVSGQADVTLVQGDAETVAVEASPRSRSRIRVRNIDGVLQVVATSDAPWWSSLAGASSRPPRVTIRFRQLETLALTGAVRLHAQRVKADTLDVRASGATELRIDDLQSGTFRFAGSGAVKSELSGRTGVQEVSISGAGAYRAPEFVSERAEVRVSGAGQVVVHATRTLDASISGAGAIDYAGNPDVRQRISGAGRIKRLSGTEWTPPARQIA